MRTAKTNTASIIVMLCLVSSIGRYVLDSYLPSMPAIAHYFTISSNNVQLTISYYLIGFSISQLIYGPLSDCLGRRRVLIVGLSIFTLANLACTFADDDFAVLLIFRFIAGLGAGSCGVLNRAIASDCFKGAAFSRAWSYTTTTLVITLILAPLLGGFVQEFFGWQANFALSTIYVGSILCVILKYLPETHQHELRIAWNAVDTLRNYRDIIQTRSFIVPTLCYTFAFSGLIAYFQISPLLLINGFGLTPMQYGYISIVIAASYLMGGLVVTRLVQIIGPKPMIKAGLLTSVAGGVCLILFSLLKLDALTIILFSVSIYVVGARIVIANAISEAFSDTRERSGTASALIGTVQMLGAAMTSSILAQFSHPNSLLLASCLSILSLCGLFTYYRLAQQAVNISTEGSEILLSNPPQA